MVILENGGNFMQNNAYERKTNIMKQTNATMFIIFAAFGMLWIGLKIFSPDGIEIYPNIYWGILSLVGSCVFGVLWFLSDEY